jgi:MoaA/NifB/PqqE/SkfB family radical SAM enzyme
VRYDIEADWQLLNTCNFRCDYCFFPHELLGEKLRLFATPEEWQAAFDATGNTWLLHITGGEPSVYPKFTELCAALTKKHFLSINSNLTHPVYRRFSEQIDPARISFINAGLHLGERESRAAIEAYLKNLGGLKARGFPVFASCVATPEMLDRFEEAVELLEPLGLYPIPKLLRGGYGGQFFPNAYRDQQKARFKHHAAAARAFHASTLSGRPEPPSINMFNDDQFMEAEPNFTGAACEAGRKFVHIEPNGDVHRCSPKLALGNLLESTFAPLASARACDTSYCFYFCLKYADRSTVRRPTLSEIIGRELKRHLALPHKLMKRPAKSRTRPMSTDGSARNPRA